MEKRTTRSHYKRIGDKLVDKVAYKTENEALTLARFLNTRPEAIHKMVAYKCIKCGMWHIGGNGTVLTKEDKEKIAKKLQTIGHERRF